MNLFERISLWLPVAFLIMLVIWLVSVGSPRLNVEFLFSEPSHDGLSGGIGQVLMNTLIIVGLALALATPISVAAAIAYVSSTLSGSIRAAWFWRLVRTVLDIGLCLPRLLWGLAGAAVFGYGFGWGVSAASGILTLAALLVPILTAGFIEALLNTSLRYKRLCDTLGFDVRDMLVGIALPAAAPSFRIAWLLASGRALGDAAALILTAGYGQRMIESWDSNASTLAVHIYMVVDGTGGGLPTATAASLVLLLMTFTLQIGVLVFGASRR